MTTTKDARPRTGMFHKDHPHYKWVALSNTTLGMLMATINGVDRADLAARDLQGHQARTRSTPGNVSYLLWMLMGYILVTAVLVVSFGRLGDMYGRVRIYNLGFVVFTVAAIALVVRPVHRRGRRALADRMARGAGASAARCCSPTRPRSSPTPSRRTGAGFAIGINQIAAIAGTFLGLIVGGVLAVIDWRAVFIVSVPFGILGTIWSYKSLHEVGARNPGKRRLARQHRSSLSASPSLLTGITYGIQPYGDSSHRLGEPVGARRRSSAASCCSCVFVVHRADASRARCSTCGCSASGPSPSATCAGLLASIGRGGLQFMLIIWLQGIWLPLHGYSYEATPLWAGIYLLPLTVGFLVSGPISGTLSDRFGARALRDRRPAAGRGDLHRRCC